MVVYVLVFIALAFILMSCVTGSWNLTVLNAC